MAITIKDPHTAALVKDLARRTGMTQDQAIAHAIEVTMEKMGPQPEAVYRDRRNARVNLWANEVSR